MTQPLTLDGVANDLDTVKDIMFTLARQYERIDRTVDQVATQQKANTEAISDLTRFMMQLGETMASTQADIRQMQSDVREMQSEVKGLQVENRRILQHIFKDEFQSCQLDSTLGWSEPLPEESRGSLVNPPAKTTNGNTEEMPLAA